MANKLGLDHLIVLRNGKVCAALGTGGQRFLQEAGGVRHLGTAFLRFLELAWAFEIPLVVVTDTDGDIN